jgi:multiple sugar transport system substrate-binding protein
MQANLNSPQAKTVLDEMLSLNDYLEPGVTKNGLFENFESFAKGNKYCNIGWGGTQKYLYEHNSVLKNHTLFSPTLGRRIDNKERYTPYFNWGWNYVVSNSSHNKELAYLFCLFASTPQISTQSVVEASGYFDPFREEHYKDEKIIAIYGEDFLKQHRYSLINSIPDFYIRGQNLYFNALQQGLFAANQKQISINLALDNVAKKWNQITEELGRKQQIEQWQNLKKQYPQSFKDVIV